MSVHGCTYEHFATSQRFTVAGPLCIVQLFNLQTTILKFVCLVKQLFSNLLTLNFTLWLI